MAERAKKPAPPVPPDRRAKPSKGRRRTALQLSRQEQVFELSVLQGKTIRQISAQLEITQETVIKDLRAEEARRSEELAAQRENAQARHLGMIDHLFERSMDLRGIPGTGALGAAAKAVEMRAKILGLDAPTKVDLGVQALWDALTPKDEPAAE
jgi:hypothetical protein